MRASRTAVLVCQGRAAADGRLAPGRFTDPTAAPMLRPDERVAVDRVRAGAAPTGWRPRVDYESVRACAELMAPRTVAVDDAVRERLGPQVVILGAGLDGRAWRMPELAGAAVFEVDQPASQRDKRDRAGALPGDPPRFVPVDFGRDRLGEALAAAGHRADTPTTWVWEGVVPYLTRAQVSATVEAVAARSAPGSRLVVNYQTPAVTTTLGRVLARLLAATTGRSSVWADEPWRSTRTPAAMAALLTRNGFTVTRTEHLLDAARRLGTPTHHPRSLRHSHLTVADHP
ncbi:class I SAM-dependent methyltransferase [Micromonospora sp. RP3T]|uniref:class I SAM-dependent methyltransferase n=1 Tax=Micromonospora sp. RP3T TaxID=2135446 RepID=UPI001E5B5846|nr:class I SAM-dependent methyltransferase [Micromonospora sp. RP3T]